MAPTKRPAGASMGGAAKKGPGAAVAKKCRAVEEAISGATGFPEEVLAMLGSNLADYLGVAVEERHAYQEKVIGMVGEVLTGLEASIQAQIADAEAKVAASGSSKAELVATEETAAAALKEKADAAGAAGVVHVDSVAALKAAKEAEKAADAELKAASNSFDAATKQKTKLESALNESYMPMKESGDASKHDACMAVLNKVGEEFDLNASLLTSLSSALAKPPDARGSFDGVCLQQVEDELAKLIADATEKVAAAEATKAAAAEKVATCQAATAAATAANDEATAKEAECKVAVKTATIDLKSASKAVKAFGPQMKQVETDLEQIKAELQGLREGALAAFAELKERSATPPTPAKTPAKEAPAEEAPAEVA